MVYVRNLNFTNWGVMGFFPDPATPISAYFEGNFRSGNSEAQTGQLSNTVASVFVDAGYQLQWNRDILAPGDVWTIIAYETWTNAGGIQIIAPPPQNASIGSTISLPFRVQNITDSAVVISIATLSLPTGWSANINGPSNFTLLSNEFRTVDVDIAIAPNMFPGSEANIVLEALGGSQPTAVGTTTLTARDLNIVINPSLVDFGTIINGNSKSEPLTITNSTGGSITFGTLSTISPFSVDADTCSGQTLSHNASCTVNTNFSPILTGAYSANLNIPVINPILLTKTVSLSGSGTSFLPNIPATLNGSIVLNSAVICCGRPVLLGQLPVPGSGTTVYNIVNTTGNVKCITGQSGTQTYLKMNGSNGSCTIVASKDGITSAPLTLYAP